MPEVLERAACASAALLDAHVAEAERARRNRGTRVRCVPPSSIDTTFVGSTWGATHSCLPHTPEPHGSSTDAPAPANSCFHSLAVRARRSASGSCTTSRRSPHFGQR